MNRHPCRTIRDIISSLPKRHRAVLLLPKNFVFVLRTLRGVGGRGVGGLNTYNKDLIRPI